MRKLLIALTTGALVLIAMPVTAASVAPTPASPSPSPAPPADPLAAKLQAQLAEEAALQTTVASLSSEVQAARATQKSLTDLVSANQVAISQTLTQLTASEQRLSDATSREATAHANALAAQHREDLDRQLLAIYLRIGYETQDGFLSYLLSSTSVSELLARAADISHVVHRSADLVAQIQRDVADAHAAENQAAADAAAATTATAQLQAQQQTLQQQTAHARDLIAQLGSQAAATLNEISAANSQTLAVVQSIAQTRLQQLDATIAAAEQAAWQAASYYLQNHLGSLPPGVGVPATAPVQGNGSQLVWPVHGAAITQPFGPSAYPFEPPFDGFAHFHTGIDLAAPLGTPVVAAADGVVAVAANTTVGYGNYIIIAHANGLLSLYGHLEVLLVHPGNVVKAGQLIGLLGSSGNSTGPHCHFEVRVNGQPVDPRPFLPPLSPGATGP